MDGKTFPEKKGSAREKRPREGGREGREGAAIIERGVKSGHRSGGVGHREAAAAAEKRERMTRGNQRDTDRKRAANRAAKGKGKSAKEVDGLTKEQRQMRDAEALQAKIAAKKAAKEAADARKK